MFEIGVLEKRFEYSYRYLKFFDDSNDKSWIDSFLELESNEQWGLPELLVLLHPKWYKEREWNTNEILVDLNNIDNKQTKIKVMNTNETTTATSVKRGRPVSATSARQARLAAWDAKRASGLEVKRGRPAKAKIVGAINPKQK